MSLARRSPVRIAPLLYWSAAAALVVWVLALVAWRERPPAPRPATASDTAFSAARAWPVLSWLADTIGYRVAGTPGADSAVAYLQRTLERAPGLQVAVQDATGAWRYPRSPNVIAYSVRNVLVRIPGRDASAVLLSAHYDSPVGSVGASDDGVAVAALVEVARALAHGPRLAHTVIINLNDGEEQGLVGSAGFLQSPWARDVRTFVNLESAGPRGRSILFQAGPGDPWLTAAYAAAVPFPYGTVLAQDIFQSGVIPSDTDFRVYRDLGGLHGLDIAFYLGGWAYHTQRDRTWNVLPGSLQQMGANTLALARVLADGPLPGPASTERAVYFDVLGLFMVSLPIHVAHLIGVLVAALGLGVIGIRLRRGALQRGPLALAAGLTVLAVCAAFVAPVALGALAAYVVRRPMSWFAHPAFGITAFALAALSGTLAVNAALARALRSRMTDPRHLAETVLAAVLIFWLVVLIALVGTPLGSVYLAVLWAVGGALALGVCPRPRSGWCWLLWLTGALPATVLTLQLLLTLTGLFVPVFGRLPIAVAPDLVLAALVAAPAAALSLALLPGAHRVGGVGRAALATGALAVLAMGASLAQPRYTSLRPERLEIVQAESDSSAVLRVSGEDYVTPRAAVAAVPGLVSASGASRRPMAYERPASPSGIPRPTLALLAERMDTAAGTRELVLRAAAPGAYRLRLRIPGGRLEGWSLPVLIPDAAHDSTKDVGVDYVAPPDGGWVFTLRVRGAAPLRLHIAAQWDRTTRDAAALIRALPQWTDAHAILRRETTVLR